MVIRVPSGSSIYALHEVDGKYYFHFGVVLLGNYLGQSELATPVEWLDTEGGAGILLTNWGIDFEEGEEPPPEDDPITYALGVRVMQDFGANWDVRGHYFADYDLALEAFDRLRLYEGFPEWGQLAVIHGWGVPLAVNLGISNPEEHSEGTIVTKSVADQRANRKEQRLSRYKRDPVI